MHLFFLMKKFISRDLFFLDFNFDNGMPFELIGYDGKSGLFGVIFFALWPTRLSRQEKTEKTKQKAIKNNQLSQNSVLLRTLPFQRDNLFIAQDSAFANGKVWWLKIKVNFYFNWLSWKLNYAVEVEWVGNLGSFVTFKSLFRGSIPKVLRLVRDEKGNWGFPMTSGWGCFSFSFQSNHYLTLDVVKMSPRLKVPSPTLPFFPPDSWLFATYAVCGVGEIPSTKGYKIIC